ncbi:MAG: DUF2946 family protein [Pseudomonadota bacterium]
MSWSKHHPLLMLCLLVAVSLRMTIAAPVCMPYMLDIAEADSAHGEHHADHAHHAHHSDMGGHGEDHESHPCCSACGPSLPPEMTEFDARLFIREVPSATQIRALATRPPFPAYDARGPPLQV